MSIIKKLRWKDKSGKTTDYDLGAKASNVEQDSTHRFVSDTEKQTWNGKANPGDIPSGSAANYGVANNDTTNRSDQLVTAQVAYQHGKEIDQLISDLIGLKTRYLIGNAVDEYGLINLGTNYPYIAAIGVGSATKNTELVYGFTVNRFFQNEYGIWYAEIYRDNKLYTDTSTEMNLFVLYATV